MSPEELEAFGLEDGQTIRVRGEGGAEFDVDIPKAGGVQRELLDDALLKGRLSIVAGEAPEKPRGRGRKPKGEAKTGDGTGPAGSESDVGDEGDMAVLAELVEAGLTEEEIVALANALVDDAKEGD